MDLETQRKIAGKIAKWVGGAFAAFMLLVIIVAIVDGGETDSPEAAKPDAAKESTKAPETAKPKEPEKPKGIDADAIHATFLEMSLGPIEDMCDAAWTHWACFFDEVEAYNSTGLRVHLTTDGGWSDSDLDEMADRAGNHWFNFTGEAHEDLDTVNVWVNGLDRKTLYRKDIFILNKD